MSFDVLANNADHPLNVFQDQLLVDSINLDLMENFTRFLRYPFTEVFREKLRKYKTKLETIYQPTSLLYCTIVHITTII